MRMFLFRVDQLNGNAVEKVRSFSGDTEATAYARQLLEDWPDCVTIDVLHEGELVDRLRPSRL